MYAMNFLWATENQFDYANQPFLWTAKEILALLPTPHKDVTRAFAALKKKPVGLSERISNQKKSSL